MTPALNYPIPSHSTLPELRSARPAAGRGTHDLSRNLLHSPARRQLFRLRPAQQYHAWTERLTSSGIPFSGEVDRYYFRSLYIREPGGSLFELATDGPGFAVDEDAATLGERLALPPFLEPQRAHIEANLKLLS
ncbi:VOC family protein [Deinococcus peraridilitoris]|uniref:VOC family protein n=1 Tax=Deinococcus peraridilitoris TaxID=432329 RepID=UPI0002ECD67C